VKATTEDFKSIDYRFQDGARTIFPPKMMQNGARIGWAPNDVDCAPNTRVASDQFSRPICHG
jgi:hypothetical protein